MVYEINTTKKERLPDINSCCCFCFYGLIFPCGSIMLATHKLYWWDQCLCGRADAKLP